MSFCISNAKQDLTYSFLTVALLFPSLAAADADDDDDCRDSFT